MTARHKRAKAPRVSRSRDAKPAIDIRIETPRWRAQPRAQAAIRRAIAAAAAALPARRKVAAAEVSVLLTGDKAIHALNRQWRGKDKPTNVLSFPSGGAPMLGDIVIAFETVARESAVENKRFLHHLAHLAVHGFLHLIGYDHETDSQARAMERLESAILAGLNIPDPYRDEFRKARR